MPNNLNLVRQLTDEVFYTTYSQGFTPSEALTLFEIKGLEPKTLLQLQKMPIRYCNVF